MSTALASHRDTLESLYRELAYRNRRRHAIRARTNILDFTTYTFPDYMVNWHHQEMAKAIDWWVDGLIHNLIIELPPRHGKSELTSRRLPAYILGRNPNAKIIATSYGADLAGMMNRDVQRIIDSEAYRELFPQTQLWGKNIRTLAQGTWLRNSEMFEVVGHRGYYRSAGIGGGITGMGATHGIIDDPIKNREEAESQTIRDKLWNWYTSTFFTRLQKGGKQLITATRWNEDDPVGRLLELQPEKWVVVRFPVLLDEDPSTFDPRELGEALWPEHKNVADLADIEQTVGQYEWNSVWQQRPHAREGGMFPVDKVQYISLAEAEALKYTGIVRWWDKAGSDEHMKGAQTAGVLMGRAADKRIIVRDVEAFRAQAREREKRISAVAQRDGNRWWTWMEQEPGSGGKESAQNTVVNNAGYKFMYETSSGSKIDRADPFAAQWQAGNVYLVRASWNAEYVKQMGAFPNGRLKDMADASSGAFSKIRVIPTSLDPKDYPKARR